MPLLQCSYERFRTVTWDMICRRISAVGQRPSLFTHPVWIEGATLDDVTAGCLEQQLDDRQVSLSQRQV